MCKGVVTEDWKKADDNEYLQCFLPRMSTQITPGYNDNTTVSPMDSARSSITRVRPGFAPNPFLDP